MALDADKLLVVGREPAAVDVIHAVAGAADPGVAGGVKSDEIDGNENRASKETDSQQLDGGKAQKVFPVHADTIYCTGWKWLQNSNTSHEKLLTGKRRIVNRIIDQSPS